MAEKELVLKSNSGLEYMYSKSAGVLPRIDYPTDLIGETGLFRVPRTAIGTHMIALAPYDPSLLEFELDLPVLLRTAGVISDNCNQRDHAAFLQPVNVSKMAASFILYDGYGRKVSAIDAKHDLCILSGDGRVVPVYGFIALVTPFVEPNPLPVIGGRSAKPSNLAA